MALRGQETTAEIDLQVFLDIFLRRRWIILPAWLAVILGTAVIVFTTPAVYQARSLLIIEKERGQAAVSAFANGVLVDTSNIEYYQTQYEIIKSNTLVQKVFDVLALSKRAEFAEPFGLEKLQDALLITPVPKSRLVYISARSVDPQLAARISNTLADIYIAQNVSHQLFISKEVLQVLQAMPNDPKTKRLYESLPPVVNNGLIQSLKGELAKLQTQLAETSQRLTARHPAMVAVRSQMESLQRQIQDETDRIITSLKSELSGQLQGNNIRVVDRAQVPLIPILPQKRKSMVVAFTAGLLLAYGLAFLVELLDQTIRTQEDVENKLQLSYLGLLPKIKMAASERPFEAMLTKENSLTGEAFRNLRTMVDFAMVSENNKAMLVTSAIKEEGKSYVSANLAVAFAQLGESVLLIGGDIRRPSVHKAFSISEQIGLSHFLAKGVDVSELQALVQPTEIHNLKVLPCGVPPPNPSELLNTPRLGALIAWAKSHFDRVIVDSTPLFPISDTLLWGRHVPCAVFVVRFGQTRVPQIRTACQRLESSGVKVLGIALNAAAPRGLSYQTYGYAYHQYYNDYQRSEPSQTRSAV